MPAHCYLVCYKCFRCFSAPGQFHLCRQSPPRCFATDDRQRLPDQIRFEDTDGYFVRSWPEPTPPLPTLSPPPVTRPAPPRSWLAPAPPPGHSAPAHIATPSFSNHS